MANPIIKILRGAGAPPTLEAGRIAIDQLNKNLVVGIDDGNGGTINEIVGGSGTFATKAFVSDAVTTATGNLGTMSTQNADSVAITGGTINGVGITGGSLSGTVNVDGLKPACTGYLDGNQLMINGGDFINAYITSPTIYHGTINGGSSIIGGSIDGATITNLPAPSADGDAATKKFVTDAVNAGTGSLGTMSTQNADAVAITGGSISGASVTNLPAPSADGDAATKKYTDDKVSALGSVFHYVGDISATNDSDLTALSDQTTGAYYRVVVAGGFYGGGSSNIQAKVGDAFVKTPSGWQKIDNVDVEVLGTEGQITVTGDENTGYTVAAHPTLLGDIQYAALTAQDAANRTQNIDPQATTSGFTKLNGDFLVNSNGSFEVKSDGWAAISVSGTAVSLNGAGMQPVTSNGTLVITNTGMGQQQGTDGTFIAINADNRIKNSAGGLDITGNSIITGDLVVTGTLNDAVIDGGTY